MVYPLAEYTGQTRTFDWSEAPTFPAGDATAGETETRWVDPEQFFSQLAGVMDEVPPVRGFWSLTLYNEHHFFHRNDCQWYSLGTKNQDLVYGENGSLTVHVGTAPPADEAQRANWLPAPDADFSLFLRAYWPEQSILDAR